MALADGEPGGALRTYRARLLDPDGTVAWEGEVRADRWLRDIPPRSVNMAVLLDPPGPLSVLSEDATYAEIARLDIQTVTYWLSSPPAEDGTLTYRRETR